MGGYFLFKDKIKEFYYPYTSMDDMQSKKSTF